MIAIYRISLSLGGNELGIVRNRPKQPNQNKWRRYLGSDLNLGPVQNEHLVVRTYDRWPLRASGFLGPLARLAPRVKNTRRASGPVVNVEAWAIRKPTSNVGAYGAKRWAINPAGHSPQHTNKVLELVSKLVVHSSNMQLLGL